MYVFNRYVTRFDILPDTGYSQGLISDLLPLQSRCDRKKPSGIKVNCEHWVPKRSVLLVTLFSPYVVLKLAWPEPDSRFTIYPDKL